MRGRAGLPALEGEIGPFDPTRFGEAKVVFLCVPPGCAAPLARQALEAGARVVDLSPDLRPGWERSAEGREAADPELCAAAVYGLTEHAREALPHTRLVSNPGCYPTAILLALKPLLEAGLVATGPIIADCKSGISGAGATPSPRTHYAEVHENCRAYAVGTHRHRGEIHAAAGREGILFVPHLLPCFRGILATLYLTPREGVNASHARELLAEAYADEAFIELTAQPPDLRRVQGTNRCAISVQEAQGHLVLVSVIDNLQKGAAGQALQNANLMLGLDEGLGLA